MYVHSLITYVGHSVADDPSAQIDIFCNIGCMADMAEREDFFIPAHGDVVEVFEESKTTAVAVLSEYVGTPCSGCMQEVTDSESELNNREYHYGRYIAPAGLATILD